MLTYLAFSSGSSPPKIPVPSSCCESISFAIGGSCVSLNWLGSLPERVRVRTSPNSSLSLTTTWDECHWHTVQPAVMQSVTLTECQHRNHILSRRHTSCSYHFGLLAAGCRQPLWCRHVSATVNDRWNVASPLITFRLHSRDLSSLMPISGMDRLRLELGHQMPILPLLTLNIARR